MINAPTEKFGTYPDKKIEVTRNLVDFFELLLKVDKRLQEKKRKESLS
jgi:hypothetical protein